MGQESDDFNDLRELIKQRRAESAPRPLPTSRKSANLDRPLTPREKVVWKIKSGFHPEDTATLRHFRRGMGGGGWRSAD